MLKKANRLAKASDIAAAFNKGRSFFNPLFTVKFLPQKNEKLFTVVVSTKVYKSAVKRNRLKRIVREKIRRNLVSYKTGRYLIIAKPKISKASEKEVLAAFAEVSNKLK